MTLNGKSRITWLGRAALAAAVGVWCSIDGGDASAQATAGKRIELTEPGVYTDSGCVYVMTKDVTAPGCGFTFEGSNCVVDLGGHTLTFNAEPYTPPAGTRYDYLPPWGVLLKGANIQLKNGTIAQGKGGKDRSHGIFAKGAPRLFWAAFMSAFVPRRPRRTPTPL